ncbi:MAG: hypothetical protein IJU56_00415 [Clostridia bacterium]|nr:hypothetical protein [Clostridia bacterium]
MKKKLLYLTDLNYQAKGRVYCAEDIFLTGKLQEHFDLALCHPVNSHRFEQDVDTIVFRNTGSTCGFQDTYDAFVRRVRTQKLKTFNEFCGKADMCGKQYLLELTKTGFPVIPTVDRVDQLERLPQAERYVVKPKNGADSIGLRFLTKEALLQTKPADGLFVMQPAIDFVYEVSFYFINDTLEYAMYAPDRDARWKLAPYAFTAEDRAFAERFIQWNSIRNGIQRVDACRTKDGRLLLMELEDLNPYLSILEVDADTRERFVRDLIAALQAY